VLEVTQGKQLGARAAAATATIPLIVFGVASQRYALPLGMVERVVQAVELKSLPHAPSVIRGMFNLHGEIMPVADLRRRLDLPEREIALNDWIIITRTSSRRLGVLAEGEADIEDCAAADIVATQDVLGASGIFDGIARLSTGLVLIQNLAAFLSIDEERALAKALDGEH
jgi:purine-binding chemotaxis protein CheW